MEDPLEFTGTDRLVVERRLGQGGFGVVYQVYDRHRLARVAVKMLRRPDAAGLYRLKQEFRSLAEISHPNLVALYELLSDADRWFITMELIHGVNFLQFVRPGTTVSEFVQTDASTATPSDEGTIGLPTQPALLQPIRFDRLRSALWQLGSGLNYLHSQGKLHRDVKESNVMVTHEGRAVLLDFGLVMETNPDMESGTQNVTGTIPYMSPEQSTNRGLTAASDWYSVGVMLFKTLTGRYPFSGSWLDVLRSKLDNEAPEPQSVVSGIPDDLNSLCCGLLARQPEERPGGDDFLARLGRPLSTLAPMGPVPPAITSARDTRFVGRERHLRVLSTAFEASKAGRAITVYVHGSSGIGKTVLVRRFLEKLRADEDDVMIFSGRCYERESVPYKALDSIVDAISRHLLLLSKLEVEAILPRNTTALARLFPVLRQVQAIAGGRQRVSSIPETQETRRRGFAALRELIGRMSDRNPLVFFIDDLQWGDEDSAELLAHLLRPPDAPALLLIVCYRSEEPAKVQLLTRLLHHASLTDTGEARELVVEEFDDSEAGEFAEALMAGHASAASATPGDIVRASGGNPFLIDQLARFAQAGSELAAAREPGDFAAIASGPSKISVDALVRARVSGLGEEARRFLETIAVLGGPLELKVATKASQTESGEISLVARLRAARLIRIRLEGEREEVEIYHDGIRAALVHDLAPPALRSRHLEVALALEASTHSDPETLATHFEGAGENARAAKYAAKAAIQASAALAFDRAARLYEAALRLQQPGHIGREQLYGGLGDVLANAGRGHEAGYAYLSAAEHHEGLDRLELKQRASVQFLRSGHLDLAFRTMDVVLKAVGLKLPRRPSYALVSSLLGRIWIRIRGLRFRERDRTQIPPKDLFRIDVCWSVAMHVGTVDNVRAAAFQARQLLFALRAGDPYRVGRAVAIEVAYSSIGGLKSQRRTQQLTAIADDLAARVGDLQLNGLVELVKGMAAYFEGRWKPALALLQSAERRLRESRSGIAWELDIVHFYMLCSLLYTGEWRELRYRLPSMLKEATERDDITATTNLRTRLGHLTCLAANDVGGARAEVEEGINAWSRDGFHAQHYFELRARVEIALYNGEAWTAWRHFQAGWARLRRSLWLRVQLILIETLSLRASAAVAVAAISHSPRERFLRIAHRDARRLQRTRVAWVVGTAGLIEAGIASVRGDIASAIRLLDSASLQFDGADMALYAAMARRRKGLLVGGGVGRDLVEAANQYLAREMVADPDRLEAMLLPGFQSSTDPTD